MYYILYTVYSTLLFYHLTNLTIMITLKDYTLFDSLIAWVEETENPLVYKNGDRRFSTLSNWDKTSDIIAVTHMLVLLFKYKQLEWGTIQITHLINQNKSEELWLTFENISTVSKPLLIKWEAPIRYCITSNNAEPQYCYGDSEKQKILSTFTRADEPEVRVI